MDLGKIYNECANALDADTIIQCAKRNNETPIGFLLTYLKDMYFLPKYYGWGIVEELLKHFDIE